jgi:hypothetical protein
MTKDEIKDVLEMNYDNNRDWLVNYIFTLESDCKKYKEATILAREMIGNSVSKDRYNNLVMKYNKLVKKTKEGKFVDMR